ncbi:MAG: RNA-directed DNA polymerase [Fusobacteriaceae bacterium]
MNEIVLKKITELSNIEAKSFFLTNRAYFSLELPDYFKFEELLEELSKEIGDAKDYNDFKNQDPKNLENINYVLFNNKDGKYDWRPFELINPVIYLSLLNCMFTEDNWKIIVDRIQSIQSNSLIEFQSIPIVEVKDTKYLNKSSNQIINWWNMIEQKSLELSLDYDYIFHTDIVDCYNSIYTHSIPWSIHTKETAKQNRKDILLGNKIDRHLQAMSYGQTNGIPQGSILMDFIAEIVLIYGDELITKKIKEFSIQASDFKILRFRDDYRIFTKQKSLGDQILKIISEELSLLGFKLHSIKTKYSNNIIQSSIKEDKINSFLLHKNNNLQKRLLLLHKFAFENPNSGSLKKELANFKKNIDKRKNFKNDNIPVLISILTDIAYKNSKTFVEVSGILSTLLNTIDDLEIKRNLVEKIFTKLQRINNSGYFEIWFQRVLIKAENSIELPFEEQLCKIIKDKTIKLWNNDWISSKKIKKILEKKSIVSLKTIDTISEIIEYDEIKIFDMYRRN